jgi:hypothetical protein
MTRIAHNRQPEGIFDIAVPGNWVLPHDELWLALVKPPLAGSVSIENDATRPQALMLADRLFSANDNGQFPIAISAQARNAVVLFPEFAFGSGDFAHLDTLIQAQPIPVMVFAGFGAINGDKLRAVIQEGRVICGWRSGLDSIDATKRYNAAWCWINDPRENGGNSHRCYVLLKNWPEQRHERVGIPNFACGTETVRLVTDDCIIFPLICADILCTDPNGAHERIVQSIHASQLDLRRVLVPVLMLDGKPSNPAWSSRLAHLIQAAPLKVAIVTCNHVNVAPESAEEDDQLRCLSGALVSVQQFSADREEIPTQPVRALTLAGMGGYVLRSAAPSIAAGYFIWRELGLANRFIWLPNMRTTLDEDGFVDAIEAPEQVEMQRWCKRVRRPAWLQADCPGAKFLESGYARIQRGLTPVGTANALWPEALTGRGLDIQFAYRLRDCSHSIRSTRKPCGTNPSAPAGLRRKCAPSLLS